MYQIYCIYIPNAICINLGIDLFCNQNLKKLTIAIDLVVIIEKNESKV